MEESTRRTPKEQGSKGFNSSISYILLGITEALAPTSHKAKQAKLLNLILTIGSQPSSSFLGIETSIQSFSSLALIRALVICLVKAILSELVWGSLAIFCENLITSERLQLSKSSSLPLIKGEVLLYKLILYLITSKLKELSCPKVEVSALPLIGPLVGLWVSWVLKVFKSSTTCIVASVVCVGRLLTLSSSSFSLHYLSLSLASILMFSSI